MAKIILTPQQSQFLELASISPGITDNFYLTGGTALSEFYLHHRESHDIDLFCEKNEIDPKLCEAYLKKISSKMKILDWKRSNFLGLFSFSLNFNNGVSLKVDFNYYPFPLIYKGKYFNKLRIDSLYDIAANKLHTIFMKPRGRDYIDLYFILQQEKYSLDQLILDAKVKFDWHIDPLHLSSQFLRAGEFEDTPKILIPYDRNKMISYFKKLSNNLKSQILVK